MNITRGVRSCEVRSVMASAWKPAPASSPSQTRRPNSPVRCSSWTTRTEPSVSRSKNAYSDRIQVSVGSGSHVHSR
jgi:hypothetical protein